MTLVQKAFEKGPQGGAWTTTDDGGLLRAISGGGSVLYDTAAKAHGTYGLKITNGASNSAQARWTVPTASLYAFSVVVSCSAAVAGGTQVISLAPDGGTNGIRVELRPDNRWAIVGAGGVAYNMTTAGVVAAGQKVRVAFVVNRGTSTTTGSMTAKLYNADTGAQIGVTVSATNANFGANPYTVVSAGVINGTADVRTVTIDDMQWDDGGTTEPAAMVDPPTNTYPLVAELGDSKTWQAGTGDVAIRDAYLARGWTTDKVRVSGVTSRVPWGEDVTPSTETTLNGWIAEPFVPAYVVTTLGGNIRNNSQATWQAQYDSLYAKLTAMGVQRIFVVNLAYQNPTDGVPFNNWLRDFVGTKTNVQLIDQYAMIRARESAGQTVSWNADGVHMLTGATGYDLLNTLKANAVDAYRTGKVPPVVTAAGNQVGIAAGANLTTSVTATDDGTIASYNATISPNVTLTGSGNSRTFVAPSSAAETTYTVIWSVTDNDGLVTTARQLFVVTAATQAPSAIFKEVTFDNLAEGVALTSANIGMAPQAATTPNSALAVASAAMHGVRGGRWSRPAGGNVAGCFSRLTYPTPTTTFQFEGYWTGEATPPGAKMIAYFGSSTGARLVALSFNASLGLYLLDAAGLGISLLGPSLIVVGRRYRVTVWGSVNAGTSGSVKARVYDTTTGQLMASRDSVSDFGSAQIARSDIGTINDVTGFTEWDTLRFGTANVEPEPYVFTEPAPSIANLANISNAESYENFTVSANASGTITEWVWRQISGPAVPFVGSGSTLNFTTPATRTTETLVFGVIARNVSASSPEATLTVTVLPHTFFAALGGVWKQAKTFFSQASARAAGIVQGTSTPTSPPVTGVSVTNLWKAPQQIDSRLAANPELQPMADQPAAKWINGQADADAIPSFISAAGAKTLVLCVYAIPNRDGGEPDNYSGGGFPDRATYLNFITSIKTKLGSHPAIISFEPDGLGHSAGQNFTAAEKAERIETLRQAVSILATIPNAETYIDASMWLDPSTTQRDLLRDVDVAKIAGFTLNTSAFNAQAACYTYGNSVVSALNGIGITGKRYIIDSSRNGVGPLTDADRPLADPWFAVGQLWCNPPKRRLGLNPGTAITGQPNCRATLWIKAPGEADGTFPNTSQSNYFGESAPSAGTFWVRYARDLLGLDPTGSGSTPPAAGAPQSLSYTASSDEIGNPDRGWFNYSEARWDDATGTGFSPLVAADLIANRTAGRPVLGSTIRYSTVVFRYYIMAHMRGVDTIPAGFLTALANDFAIARQAGVKLMPRFVYSNDDSSRGTNGENGPYNSDTTPARTIGHVQQLAATINANADVIHAVQQGFVGTWGEQYYTDNWGTLGNLTQQNWDDRAKLITAMLQWDARVKVLVRYPGLKYRYIREGSGNGWAAPANASGRLGFHNDGFLAPFNDFGTFHTFPDGQTVEQLKAYLQAQALTGLPVTGESASAAGEGGADTSYTQAKIRLSSEHWSTLNPNYRDSILNLWSQSDKDEIGRLLGYRFRLTSAELPSTGAAGSSQTVVLRISNDGWGVTTMDRPIQLVFVNGSTVVERTLNRNARTLSSGPNVITETVQLPGAGTWSMHVAFPDPNLPTRAEYAIRLANTTTWANGRNALGATVTVSA